MASENRKQVFAFAELKPTQRSGLFISVPKSARAAKKRAFRIQHFTAKHESSLLRRGMTTKLGVRMLH